jgi:hypothetical protein
VTAPRGDDIPPHTLQPGKTVSIMRNSDYIDQSIGSVTVGQAMQALLDEQAKRDEEWRLALWNGLMEGYCHNCGRELDGTRCYCVNDE